jgi:hypothetical protein
VLSDRHTGQASGSGMLDHPGRFDRAVERALARVDMEVDEERARRRHSLLTIMGVDTESHYTLSSWTGMGVAAWSRPDVNEGSSHSAGVD